MTKPIAAAPAPKRAGKGVEEFRAAHDKDFIVPQKIRDGLKKLGNGWEYEGDFVRLAMLSQTDMALYRDGFADFWFEVSGHTKRRVWCGSKELAEKLRAMV